VADSAHSEHDDDAPDKLPHAPTPRLQPPAFSDPPPAGIRHYLELISDRSRKFWEITVDGHEHTVRFGRIGSRGQSLTRRFESPAAAQQDADRLLRQKRRKGYREC
jgi:predicted DNA-binding WGR domain protein